MNCRLLGVAILFTLLPSASGAKINRADLAALRPRLDPSTLPTVPSACVDGQSGWRLLPHGQSRAELLRALRTFSWPERHYDVPDFDCHFSVEILCAPDLNADRKSDFLVRLLWRIPARTSGKRSCPKTPDRSLVRREAVLVASRRTEKSTPSWKIFDVISFSSDTAMGGLPRARVSFVELPDGKIGLACKTQTEDQGEGCQVLSYWVGALVGERIERLGEADPELCKPDAPPQKP